MRLCFIVAGAARDREWHGWDRCERLLGFASGECEFFASHEETTDPSAEAQLCFGGCGVMAEGFDVKAYGEALLRASEVDHRRADDAVEHRVGMVERFGVTREAVAGAAPEGETRQRESARARGRRCSWRNRQRLPRVRRSG